MSDIDRRPATDDSARGFTVVATMDDVDGDAGHVHFVHEGHIHVFAEAECDDVEGHGGCRKCT